MYHTIGKINHSHKQKHLREEREEILCNRTLILPPL